MTDRLDDMGMKKDPPRHKKAKNAKGRKQSAATIAKRMETMRRKKAGLAGPDIGGAIAALRAAKRRIRADFCAGVLKDFGDVELNVLIALRHLQGGTS